MNKRMNWGACAALILSLILTVGSRTFLGACTHEDGSFGACHWANQAMFGLGILLSAQSLAALPARDERIRMGLLIAEAMTAVLGMFIPGTLISLCKMPSMVCLSTMKPAMLILCAVILLAALAGILQARKRAK